MTLIALLVSVVGSYLLIGILKEMSNLEFLIKYVSGLSRPSKDEIVRKMMAENANSLLRLVEVLLRAIEGASVRKKARSR
jgi:hypothetical protein